LRGNSWFALYSEQELKLLADFLKVRAFENGGVVYAEASPATGCFIVMEGAVKTCKDVPEGRREELATFGSGALVGLVALIDGKRHSGTCVAAGNTTCLELSREEFERLFAARSALAYKFIVRVVRVLVRQLRLVDDRLAAISQRMKAGAAPRSEALELLAEADHTMTQDIELDDVDHAICKEQGPQQPEGRPPWE
jgi:CRP-like cAMP-binding protein